MKRPYETVIVFDGTLPDEALQKEQKKIEEFLQQSTTFEKTDVWGKKALAYPVRKKRSGYYCMFLYEGEGNVAAAMDKYLKLNEAILRHLTLQRNVENDIARAELAVRREKAVAEGEGDGREERRPREGGHRWERRDREPREHRSRSYRD